MKNTLIKLILIILTLGVLFSLMMLAWVPPISRDALIHHLAIPKLYLQHGGIYQIPELVFSYYPMNLDLLYLGALYLGSDILPKYIHMAFGIGTALLLFIYFYRRLSVNYALLGSLIFLSIPIIVKLSVTVYVDLGLVFFSTAAFFLIIHWAENNFKSRYLVLAGICCGLGVGTKYNGLLVLFLLTLCIPIYYLRSTDQKRISSAASIKAALLFFFCALLVASPWLVRNYAWTGNPIYPLFDSFFSSSLSAGSEATTAGSSIRGVFATRHALYGETFWQLILLPVRIFFEGMDDNPRFFDGRLNPFLLLFSLFAFFCRSNYSKQIHIEKTIIAAFCLLYFLFSFNTTALRIRYLSPIIPFMVVLSMYGLANIASLLQRTSNNRYFTLGIWLISIMSMLFINLKYIYGQFKYIDPFPYITNQISRDDYISSYRPEHKLIQYANTHFPESAEILCVFTGWRGYYFDVPTHFDDRFNTKWFLAWLDEPNMTDEIAFNRLRDRNVNHLLIRTDLFAQWLKERKSSRVKIWSTIRTKYFQPIASHQNYTLYKIK